MPETRENEGLTAVQIAALRKCDDVCFHHREGRSYITAAKRAKVTSADPFAVGRDVHIPCETRWTDYARETGMSYPTPEFNAFHMTGNYDESEWRTIAHLLRPGDRLTLYWQRDAARTQNLTDSQFHADRLALIVDRGGNVKRLRFHVATSVCPDNTARMIRNVRARPLPPLPSVIEQGDAESEVKEGEGQQ